jgi:formamidopyrimidine-DNA glycosylase
MIELPEAFVLACQINQTLLGKRILHAAANTSPHKFAWYTGDPAKYNDLLAGKTIGIAQAFGGQVEIEVEDRVLILGTALKFHPSGEKLPLKHQLLLEFEDCSSLTASIQMWGCLMCPPKGEPVTFEGYSQSKLLPSPLDEKFDRTYFDSLFDMEAHNLSAKEFLAAHQRIPGLGNGVLQDILWSAEVHPRRKMGDLRSIEVDNLFTALLAVLRAMAAKGGRDTERDLFDKPGGYQTIMSKNTNGKPCKVCGSPIRRETYLGGNVYICPICQPL